MAKKQAEREAEREAALAKLEAAAPALCDAHCLIEGHGGAKLSLYCHTCACAVCGWVVRP